MDLIPEVSNEDVDQPAKVESDNSSPENNIYERSIKLLNEKLEKALDSEEEKSKMLEEAQAEVKDLRNKLSEVNKSYETKVNTLFTLAKILDHKAAERGKRAKEYCQE